MYEGRQLHLEDGWLDFDPVEVDEFDEVDVAEVGEDGEVEKVEFSARPCTKQVRLPIVTK